MRAFLTLVLAAVLTAGCLGGSNTPTPSSPATGTPTPTPTSAPGATEKTVEISGFAFNPQGLQVDPGTTVVWKNLDSTMHSATSADGKFDSGGLAQGATFRFTFKDAGTYAYTCKFHPSMRGAIQVGPPGGTPPGSPTPPPSGAAVKIENFAFAPSSVTLSAGGSVVWTNRDAVAHTVTSDAGAAAPFDSGNLATDGTFTHTFPTAGTFGYHCKIHPTMTGTVVVK